MKDKRVERSGLFVVGMTVILTLVIANTFGFGRYLFRVLLPQIQEDIGFSYATAGLLNGLIPSGYLVITAVLPAYTHRIGATRLVLMANLLCGLGLLLMPSLTAVWLIGLLLAIFGAASSGSWVPMVDVVRLFAPKQHEGKILGLITSGVNYGVFVTGLMIPAVLPEFGWRRMWIVAGVATLLITAVTFMVMGRGGMLAKPAIAEDAKAANRPVKLRWWARLKGVERPFIILTIAHGVAGFYGPTLSAYLSPYIQDEMGFSVLVSGRVWTIIGIGGMISGFVMGWLGDRIGIKKTLMLTYSSGAIATALFLHHQFEAEIMIGGALYAFGFIPMYGLVAAYISKAAKPSDITLIFGVVNIAHSITGTAGAFIGGFILTWTGSFFWLYLLILTAVLIALGTATFLPRSRTIAPQSYSVKENQDEH